MVNKAKRSYHFSSKQRAKMAARRAQKAAEKKVEVEQKKLLRTRDRVQAKKRAARKKAEVVKTLSEKITGTASAKVGKIVTEDEVEEANSSALKRIIEDEVEVIFKPNPGPQTEFLAAPETEVLYGGSAGGGKSYAMLIDPLRDAHNPNHKGLLIRKTMPELQELLDKADHLYPKAFPGAAWKAKESRWKFPSGATIQMSFVDVDRDVHRFQGQAYNWIGIDELGHYESPYVWDYLRSRLRRTDPTLIPYMRATANPGGLGGWWIKKMFVDPAPWGEAFWATDIENNEILCYPDSEFVDEELRGKPILKRRFIPAKLTDNPYLMHSAEYMGNLASLPEVQRMRLLEGNWDITEDSAFPEFDRAIHVVEHFTPDPGWFRFRACDYGYVAPSAVLWFAVAFDGTLYVYKELYQKGLDGEALAERILEMEYDEPRPIVGVLDNESWSQRGQRGLDVANTMIRAGVQWIKATKGPGSRLNGKAELHRRFAMNPETDTPGLVISDRCKDLIRTLPILPLDPNKPEDVDTKFREDHLYDALRYGVQSRFTQANTHPLVHTHSYQDYQPASSYFGY